MHDPENSYSEEECIATLGRLFPQGFAGPDVMAEIAPGGWADSPLLAVFHPSLEQVHQEAVRIHQNIASLRREADEPLPEPTLEEVAREYRPTPVETDREVRELVGMCLWDVFSDNHDVLGADGRAYHLGSFRSSGGILADVLNRQIGRHRYDYLDFYMGTCRVAGRADLTPVYEMIFRRLKRENLDWRYAFPRYYLVDFRPLRDALKEQGPDWEGYSPEESLAKDQEEATRDQELAEVRADLDEAHQEAVAAAGDGPPPRTVQAYWNVYGRWPEGWPSGE